jgi:Esterase-like activity of phytase
VGRTTRIVGACVAGAAVIAGAALAAAIVAPAKAELAADAIPIGTGMGRTWHLGGFSDLYPNGMSGKEFTSITDRGPNFDAGAAGTPAAACPQSTPVGTKVYPLPGFTPEILQLGVKDDELVVKERTALRFPNGPAVGFSVRPGGRNEISVDGTCASLGTSPFGIDSEGIVEDPRDGSFWIADEYLPSLMHVLQNGTVVNRIVPIGTQASVAGTGAAVIGAFPATIGTNFRTNRGFEGIAISPDGTTLYAGLQSPMDYRTTGAERPSPNPRNSLALRVFRLDIANAAAPAVTAQWVYPLDSNGSGPLADKVSTLTWLGPDRIAVEERDDPANDPNDDPQNTTNTRLYVADFARATVLPADSVWNGAGAGGKTLEQWYIPGQGAGAPSDLPSAAPKCLWVNVAQLLVSSGFTDPTLPTRAGNGKIEGVAYLPARGANPALLAVLNDNDFGLVVPIREQLDVLGAPAVCTPS